MRVIAFIYYGLYVVDSIPNSLPCQAVFHCVYVLKNNDELFWSVFRHFSRVWIDSDFCISDIWLFSIRGKSLYFAPLTLRSPQGHILTTAQIRAESLMAASGVERSRMLDPDLSQNAPWLRRFGDNRVQSRDILHLWSHT